MCVHVTNEEGPPRKRAKTGITNRLCADLDGAIDRDDNEHLVQQLRAEIEKHRPKTKVIKQLMDDTLAMRRKWIMDEQPEVATIVAKFPCLQTRRWVSLFFMPLYDNTTCTFCARVHT